ncbi:rabphilin-3A [Atheta coriaria]|uniref:rabphilin-3A n=1 Tax=Dalotia coriaria TaxID=877792 RepID=UPI0031F42AC6
MVDLGENKNRFVCPNDRQLSLRAKLKTGWSVKTSSYGQRQQLEPINIEEQETIIEVIKRNEQLECMEQERVGKLMERLEKLRRNALGKTQKQCLLCGEHFGFLGTQKLTCNDCKQSVCHKCSIDGSISCLCLICSETREVWKKSGAWFFKSFPKFVLPPPINSSMARKSKIDEEDNSSDDEPKPRMWKVERRNSSTESTQLQDSLEYSRQASSSESQISKDEGYDFDTMSRRESLLSRSVSELYWSDDRISPGASSLASIFKNPADERKQLDASLGIMELALTYDPITSTLHCTIYRCKNLIPMDINGLSDPYCKINVLPSVNKSTRLKTKTVHKTRNPEFNEYLTFYEITESDLARKALHVIVVDDDKYGDDYMGEIRVPLAKLKVQNTVYLTLPLERLTPENKVPGLELTEWFDDYGTSRGQILISLCYNTKKRALLVTIMRCANLLPMDNNGYSDPFVKLHLRPDPYHRKHKTTTKRKCLNPVYNEEFAFESRPNELATQALHIAVWDKDFGKPNDYLGGLVIGGAGSKGQRLKHWLDMIHYPDHRHELWHNLTENQTE